MDHRMIFLSSLLLLNSLLGLEAVEYAATNVEPTSPGGVIFANELGDEYTRQTIDSASTFIWQTFGQATEADRKPVQRIDAFIKDTTGDIPRAPDAPAYAFTEGTTGNIYVNTKYIEIIQRNSIDVKREITGVLYHETTHIWQSDGNNQAPGWLTEGIADYVRLKADLAPAHWVKPGEGGSWTDSYDVTARFLDYCNSVRDGFVAELNGKMRDSYSDNFFVDLLNKPVDQLWNDYKAQYGN